MTWLSAYVSKGTYRLVCEIAVRMRKTPAMIVGEIVEEWVREQMKRVQV